MLIAQPLVKLRKINHRLRWCLAGKICRRHVALLTLARHRSTTAFHWTLLPFILRDLTRIIMIRTGLNRWSSRRQLEVESRELYPMEVTIVGAGADRQPIWKHGRPCKRTNLAAALPIICSRRSMLCSRQRADRAQVASVSAAGLTSCNQVTNGKIWPKRWRSRIWKIKAAKLRFKKRNCSRKC